MHIEMEVTVNGGNLVRRDLSGAERHMQHRNNTTGEKGVQWGCSHSVGQKTAEENPGSGSIRLVERPECSR